MIAPKTFRALAVATLCLFVMSNAASARDPDKVVLYLDWSPQVEDAGFFQAVQTGIYRRYGLDVTIKPGGPQLNTNLILLSDQADFIMLHSSGQLISAVERHLPLIAVAAIYQKDPQVILSHKGVGHDSLEALAHSSIMISQDARSSFWPWLKAKFKYSDDQIRPYTFQLSPFLTDEQAIQQAYLTSEPFTISKAGADPNVFLLSDHGWEGYSSLIVTKVGKDPELVRRFVQASIEGWYSYWESPSPAETAVRSISAEQTPAQMQFTRSRLASYGIVMSGDALKLGIGAMTDHRWKAFYDELAAAGLYPKGLDYTKAFTLAYVDGKPFIASLTVKYPDAVKEAISGQATKQP